MCGFFLWETEFGRPIERKYASSGSGDALLLPLFLSIWYWSGNAGNGKIAIDDGEGTHKPLRILRTLTKMSIAANSSI